MEARSGPFTFHNYHDAPLPCGLCETMFTGKHRERNLRRHTNSKHRDPLVPCPICYKLLNRSDALSVHMRRKHPGAKASLSYNKTTDITGTDLLMSSSHETGVHGECPTSSIMPPHDVPCRPDLQILRYIEDLELLWEGLKGRFLDILPPMGNSMIAIFGFSDLATLAFKTAVSHILALYSALNAGESEDWELETTFEVSKETQQVEAAALYALRDLLEGHLRTTDASMTLCLDWLHNGGRAVEEMQLKEVVVAIRSQIEAYMDMDMDGG